jgi:hypothetical protein
MISVSGPPHRRCSTSATSCGIASPTTSGATWKDARRVLQERQAIPVGVVAGETGDFEAEHDTDASERHFSSEASEATAFDDARTG